MSTLHTIEVFSAGCPTCRETLELVQRVARPSCEIRVLDMRDDATAERARALGIRSVPALAVDGELLSCCAGRGPDEGALSDAIDR